MSTTPSIEWTINVRYASATYIARGGGKTASCTAGAEEAARALAKKLCPGGFELQAIHTGHLASLYVLRPANPQPETKP